MTEDFDGKILEKAYNQVTYQKEIDRLIEIYGRTWLEELGRLIVEGDKEQNERQ